MAEIIARTGLGWGSGKELSVEVGKLGFICFSLMALGLNGCSPVAAKAALMVSEVKAQRYAHPKTPAKSFLPTFAKCKSSNASISFRNSVFIFVKQTTSSP
jgi:hypothetical protein